MDTTVVTHAVHQVATHSAPSADFGIFNQLTQYGPLGVAVLALGYAAWYMFKRQMNENDRLQKKVDELEKEKRS